MRNLAGFSFVFVIVIFGIFYFMFFVNANNIVTLEANIISSDQYTMIEVEDSYLSFGNISKGYLSSSKYTCINNTGTMEVIVTLDLTSADSEFSNYLTARRYNSGVYDTINKFNVTLGTSSSERRKCVQFILNLANYTEPIYSPIINYRANITIRAVPV